MSAQPEALRLADNIEAGYYGHCPQAAAELRRLHIENEAFGLHLSERMKDLARVEAQRDALLELVVEMDRHEGAEGWSEDLRVKIDATIKAVEGENHAKNL